MMNIGVFDSGLGGLWILKHLKETLPEYDYVFFADQANAPYGTKSIEELFACTIKVLDYLYDEKNCAGVILACNTVSSNIYDRLRDWKDSKYPGKILFGIVRPTVDSLDKDLPTVVFATPRTCESEVYDNFLKERIKNYIKIPLPDLASIIENGGDSYSYISSFADQVGGDITRGALLCTHYGIVKDDFNKAFPNIKDWIYQEEIVPKYLKDYFKEFPEREAFFSHGGTVSILVSKENAVFDDFTKKWFGDNIKIDKVDLK